MNSSPVSMFFIEVMYPPTFEQKLIILPPKLFLRLMLVNQYLYQDHPIIVCLLAKFLHRAHHSHFRHYHNVVPDMSLILDTLVFYGVAFMKPPPSRLHCQGYPTHMFSQLQPSALSQSTKLRM